MRLIYAEIELINGDDLALVRRNIIGEEEVKRMRVIALVDKDFCMICINKNIQEQLGLPVIGKRKVRMANENIIECNVVGPVDFQYKNCRDSRTTLVLPKDATPRIHTDLLNDGLARIPYYRLVETILK